MSSASALFRVVIDTNQLVSGVVLKRGAPKDCVDAWAQGAFTLLISSPVLDEYEDVLRRPKLLTARGVTRQEIDFFLLVIAIGAEMVSSLPAVPVPVRDPTDEPFLATALGGNANFLVTGDNDLLALAGDPRLGDLRIVTVAQFLRVLQPQADAGPGRTADP